MKKLIQITLVAVATLIASADTTANLVVDFENNQGSSKDHYVLCRIDNSNMQAYVLFYGPASRIGEEVEVRIIDTINGSILQQEYFNAEGNGQMEQFSLEGLEPGVYTIEVVGDKYNANQLFLIPS